MSKSIQVTKGRPLITYAEIWRSSDVLLQLGRRRRIDRGDATLPLFLASSMFSAFAFEAFLNHVGKHLFTSWEKIERGLRYKAKVALICERCGITVDLGTEPWQTIDRLFSSRNAVVHGKTTDLHDERTLPYDGSYEQVLAEGLSANWERFGTEEQAAAVRAQIEVAIRTIHAAAKLPEEILFSTGISWSRAQLVDAESLPKKAQGSIGTGSKKPNRRG